MPHDTRDQVVGFVGKWSEKTDIPACGFVRMLGICRSKFYDWMDRYGMANEHNAWIPQDNWLLLWERDAFGHFSVNQDKLRQGLGEADPDADRKPHL